MAKFDLLGLASLKPELAQLSADVEQMLRLRWELASLELRAAQAQVKQLAVGLATAVVLGLTALPLLAVSAADLLDGILGLSRTGWLAVMGAVLLFTALLVAGLAWRNFRRRFVGLEESLEELREDLVWLREWTHRAKGPTE